MKKMINKGSAAIVGGVALALCVSVGSLRSAQPALQRARSMSLPAASMAPMAPKPVSDQPFGRMAGARFGITPTQQEAFRSLKPRGLMPAFKKLPAEKLDLTSRNNPYVPADYRQRFLALSPELQAVGAEMIPAAGGPAVLMKALEGYSPRERAFVEGLTPEQRWAMKGAVPRRGYYPPFMLPEKSYPRGYGDLADIMDPASSEFQSALRAGLSPDHQARFDALPPELKARVGASLDHPGQTWLAERQIDLLVPWHGYQTPEEVAAQFMDPATLRAVGQTTMYDIPLSSVFATD